MKEVTLRGPGLTVRGGTCRMWVFPWSQHPMSSLPPPGEDTYSEGTDGEESYESDNSFSSGIDESDAEVCHCLLWHCNWAGLSQLGWGRRRLRRGLEWHGEGRRTCWQREGFRGGSCVCNPSLNSTLWATYLHRVTMRIEATNGDAVARPAVTLDGMYNIPYSTSQLH